MFSSIMGTIEHQRLAEILANAPVWARLAVTTASESLRERAADQLATLIILKLDQPGTVADERQMRLSL